jgi:hypothetical protein
MDKRYPRGEITDVNGDTVLGELIEIKPEGAYFFRESEEFTVFMPFTSLHDIQFEAIPQELIDKMEAGNGEVSGTDTVKDDSKD